MFEEMIRLIEGHATYGPAMRKAAEEKVRLVLNYHTHGKPSGYCVSITRQESFASGILRTAESGGELVHVKGVGREAGQCLPLMTALGRELREHYGFDEDPVIHLNGRPAEPST